MFFLLLQLALLTSRIDDLEKYSRQLSGEIARIELLTKNHTNILNRLAKEIKQLKDLLIIFFYINAFLIITLIIIIIYLLFRHK